MSEKETPKREFTSMRVPVEVASICKAYSQLAEMESVGTRVTVTDAFEKIYKPVMDIEKIKNASAQLEKIRQNSIKESKGILKGLLWQ